MSERFYVATPIIADRATLDGPEAHHLARVMRARVGDSVTLFDGSGWEFVAQIESIGKSRIEFVVCQRRELNRESPVPLTLAVALPKGDRQRWLVEKAVELGVAVLVPLETQRGVAQPSVSALGRLRRTVIEASKQCGRNRLLEIAAPQPWGTYVTASHDGLKMVAHPGGNVLCSVWPSQAADAGNLPATGVTAAIGPEGGFTDEEIAQAVAVGWKAIDLGPRILRVETAAIAVAAWAAFMGAEICR